MAHWKDVWHFHENPFDLEPLLPSDKGMELFVNRESETKVISSSITSSDPKGRFIFLSGVGVGKSTMLNYVIYLAKKQLKNPLILSVDARVHRNKFSFYAKLLDALLKQTATYPKARKIAEKEIEDVLTVKVRKGTVKKIEREVGGKIGAPQVLNFLLKMQLEGKLRGGELESEERIIKGLPSEIKLASAFESITNAVLKEKVFSAVIITSDNLDKIYDPAVVQAFIEDVIGSLPANTVSYFTGNVEILTGRLSKMIYDEFYYPFYLEGVSEMPTARLFLGGRINKCGGKKFPFADKATEFVVDRVAGNLRELLRYCSYAMDAFGDSGKPITPKQMQKAISAVDATRYGMLNPEDKLLLATIARKIGIKPFSRHGKEFRAATKRFRRGKRVLLDKLAGFVQLGLLRIKVEARGPRAALYILPLSVKVALEKFGE